VSVLQIEIKEETNFL